MTPNGRIPLLRFGTTRRFDPVLVAAWLEEDLYQWFAGTLAFAAASSKTDQAAIAETFTEHGAEAFAAAWLRRKGLDWAATLLTTPEETSDDR